MFDLFGRRLSKDTDETSLMDSVDLGSPFKADQHTAVGTASTGTTSISLPTSPTDQYTGLLQHTSNPTPEGSTAMANQPGGSADQLSPSQASLLLEQEPKFGDLLSAMKALLENKLVSTFIFNLL